MIVGAGLAGLIAANAIPNTEIYERAPEPTETHKAVLRFRDLGVSRLTGIEFESVTVRKGIWHEGAFVEPSIKLGNLYSRKVIGKVLSRSAWNVDSVRRYIAPEDFYTRLVESLGDRILWGTDVDFNTIRNSPAPVINTSPLPIVIEELGYEIRDAPKFEYASISVKRYRVPGANVHQTVYYPTHEHNLYRASITGDLMICEFNADERTGPGQLPTFDNERAWYADVLSSFGLGSGDLKREEDQVKQRYGKIAPIDEGMRRTVLQRLTEDYDIYSLGRFATWRNILLDDLVNDIAIIRRLLTSSGYERRLIANRSGNAA